MVVQSHGKKWRARRKFFGQWFLGPGRASKEVAEADKRKLDSATSVEGLQEVQGKLSTTENLAVVEKHHDGWRARWGPRTARRYGPTRRDEATAQEDVRCLRDACQGADQESVIRQLSLSKEFPMQYLKVCLGDWNPSSLPRRQHGKYMSEVNKPENACVKRACELLVSEYQLSEKLAARVDAEWLQKLGPFIRLDSGSRPVGTEGLENHAPISGLRNLGNSCWLNAVLQCFLHCGPLVADLLMCEKGTLLGQLLQDTLKKLRSMDFDVVAPFELLHQIYMTSNQFAAGESADASEVAVLLLDKGLSQHSLVASMNAITGDAVL